MFLEVATMLWNSMRESSSMWKVATILFNTIPLRLFRCTRGSMQLVTPFPSSVFLEGIPTARRSSSMIRPVQQAADPRTTIKIIQRLKSNARALFVHLL
jgi:hypothetical protein